MGMTNDAGRPVVLNSRQELHIWLPALQTRVALSKEERKALKAKRSASLSGSGLVADFADDVAGVLDEGAGAANAGEAAYHDKLRLGQKFGGSLGAERAAPASGGALGDAV
jgi:hypothetical protein